MMLHLAYVSNRWLRSLQYVVSTPSLTLKFDDFSFRDKSAGKGVLQTSQEVPKQLHGSTFMDLVIITSEFNDWEHPVFELGQLNPIAALSFELGMLLRAC